jgi:sulfhydrogenase subunit delta
MADKLKVGIYGLTGCGGDQLTILNCEDELLDIVSAVDLVSFLMAKSDNQEGPLDVALVEGSVSTKDNEDLLTDLRERSRLVIAIGNCACFGGPQAMKAGDGAWEQRMERVYGSTRPHPTEPAEARPASAVVGVDFCIPGCPIDKGQFLRNLSRVLRGSSPELPAVPVCVECKFRENECLLLKSIPCLGPLTTAGCGAVCPTYMTPCVGCFGPVDEANVASEYQLLLEKGFSRDEVIRRMRTYGGVAAQTLTADLPEPPPRAIQEEGPAEGATQVEEGPEKEPEETPEDTGGKKKGRGGGMLRRRGRRR